MLNDVHDYDSFKGVFERSVWIAFVEGDLSGVIKGAEVALESRKDTTASTANVVCFSFNKIVYFIISGTLHGSNSSGDLIALVSKFRM